MGKLAGKIALVTGSDSGIGKAIARALGNEGATIVVTYHSNEERGKATIEEFNALNIDCMLHHLNVGQEKDVSALFKEVVDTYGKIDILVNNAAVNGRDIFVADMDTEVFDLCIKTNLYGPFYCCREFLKYWDFRRKGGKIINVSSIHEDVVTAGNADYNASKGGLKNFSRSLALELADKGICVNNIAPGMILTAMNEEAMNDEDVKEEAEQNIPMKRAGNTKDIEAAAVFLASEDSNYVTGTTITIDGGLSINLGQGA